MKHFFRLHLLRQLHHAAVRAKCHLKFKEILIGKLSRAKKAIRNRHPAEGHEWFNQSITYQARIHGFLANHKLDMVKSFTKMYCVHKASFMEDCKFFFERCKCLVHRRLSWVYLEILERNVARHLSIFVLFSDVA